MEIKLIFRCVSSLTHSVFQPNPLARERLLPGTVFPRHRHACGYVALILSGGFEEAGEFGRRTVGPGDVLFHPAFTAHTDRNVRATDILNFLIPHDFELSSVHGSVEDPDEIARVGERDRRRALQLLLDKFTPAPIDVQDWPDLLCRALAEPSDFRLQDWALENGLHPAAVPRAFARLYGTTPARYRIELRARRAWDRLINSDWSHGEIAYRLGYSDQAHMSRHVSALTGRSPIHWRRLKSFKT